MLTYIEKASAHSSFGTALPAAQPHTERERERYEIAADAYTTALVGAADEEQQRVAQRAASEALSRQINAHLRDPPLIE